MAKSKSWEIPGACGRVGTHLGSCSAQTQCPGVIKSVKADRNIYLLRVSLHTTCTPEKEPETKDKADGSGVGWDGGWAAWVEHRPVAGPPVLPEGGRTLFVYLRMLACLQGKAE